MEGKALICDLDDTLWSRREAIERWAGVVANKFDRSKASTVSEVLDVALRDDMPWPRALAVLRRTLELPAPLEDLLEWHSETYPVCFRAFSGVDASLAKLRRTGWRLAAASNGPARRQQAKLQATGLSGSFDVLVFSDEVRSTKPDRAFFEAVIQRLQPAVDVWVVGDSPVQDVKGGQSAGARTGWVSAGRSWPFFDRPPDLMARSFVELADLLEAS